MANINGDAGDNLIFGDQADSLTPIGANFIDQENTEDLLFGRGGDDTIYGLGGNDRFINGNEGNDLLSGGPGDDKSSGGNGNDTVIGGSGGDDLQGNRDNDLLLGLEDDDSLEGGRDDDTIFGGLDSDILRGDENSDQLFGGDGNDFLDGGRLSTDGIPNVDSLTGGAGIDKFALRPHDTGIGHSLTITDYLDGTDQLAILIDSNDTQVPAAGGGDVTFPDLAFAGVFIGGDPILTDTQITFTSPGGGVQTLAILLDTNPGDITVADFSVFDPGAE